MDQKQERRDSKMESVKSVDANSGGAHCGSARAIHSFIVSPAKGRRYDNIKSIGGMDFITSSSEEDHKASNRYAIVVSVPVNYGGPIKPGYTLLVHHNVFKYYNDMRGERRSGRSFIKDDVFFVEHDQYFMYHDGVDWNTHDRYCFVEPIRKGDFKHHKYAKMGAYEPLIGKMAYPNKRLLDLGVNAGDTICFHPDSEYEFFVDGKLMYRMFDSNIAFKL